MTMKFRDLLELLGDEPVFETSLLLAGATDPGDVQRQLSRWVRAGKLAQLRRGLYVLANPYRKIEPHPFVVGNRLVRGSYVSLESALAFGGHIPEEVVAVTSVTPGRPSTRLTPLGTYLYRHLSAAYSGGYRSVEVTHGQRAFVAFPEKALLDLCHLVPGADDPVYLEGLRLQRVEAFDLERMYRFARGAKSPKLLRCARAFEALAAAGSEEYREL